MGIGLFSKKSNVQTPRRQRRKGNASPLQNKVENFQPTSYEAFDSDPLKSLFQQGRLTEILREETRWTTHPGGVEILERTKEALEQQMALVPAGNVSLPPSISTESTQPDEESSVAPFLLDVHCVTNTRFQKFVDAGGYDALEFWPEEIWPHLIELKDLTEQPGPRFWRQGRCDVRLTEHPVIGISWFEAQAYALWIGQRLPTEAEWQMAASWHLNSSTDMMRRFPWGDAMDRNRCNVWSSRIAATVPVTEYPNGAAPNHVLQLVGNVWEWTDTEYNTSDENGRPIVGEMPMHVIRGGAFDTYFELQATSQFRTGQIALARTHNTGIRCAMDLDEATWINGS